MPRYYTLDEVAPRVRLSARTLRRLVAQDKMPAYQLGPGARLLFDLDEVRATIQQHRRPESRPAGA